MITTLKSQWRKLIEQHPQWDRAHNQDEVISDLLIHHPWVHKSCLIFCFHPFSDEPALRSFFGMGTRELFVIPPSVVSMSFLYDSITLLLQDFEYHEVLILVPGRAFTRYGLRLGRGGGFYDVLLSSFPLLRSIALCYSFQLYPWIPHEYHDVRVKSIVHPGGIVFCEREYSSP